MAIRSATIRITEKYTLIDAVVDGEFREGFVLYDGTTIEHEEAAHNYLVRAGVDLDDSRSDSRRTRGTRNELVSPTRTH